MGRSNWYGPQPASRRAGTHLQDTTPLLSLQTLSMLFLTRTGRPRSSSWTSASAKLQAEKES